MLYSQYSQARQLFNARSLYYPYGNSASKNALENYYDLSSSVRESINVLFLGCGDMRNAFHTATQGPTDVMNLNIHLNDSCVPVIARNVLITQIVTNKEFIATNPDDLQYVWDVWYSTQWNDTTAKRFLKDVEQLLAGQWRSNSSIVITADADISILEKTWSYWKDTVSTMNADIFSNIMQQRGQHISEFYICKLKAQQKDINSSSTVPSFDQVIPKLITEMEFRMPLNDCTESLKPAIIKEFEHFVRTGNCEPLKDCVYINPTMLETSTNRWLVHYLACPFEAYFPIPYAKCSAVANQHSGKVVLRHCQTALKDFLVKFQSCKSKITFHFYTEDCLKLCLFNPDLKCRFQVIDTSNLADHVGLINLIYTAATCLDDSPNALLMTDTMNWQSLKPSIAEYIEVAMCCPISMIPTLYGVRLTNHVRLGNPVPIDPMRYASSPTLLVWQKAPVYSNNIKLTLSSTLRSIITKLKKMCFFIAEEDPYPEESCAMKIYTTITYYNIVQSFMSRFTLVEDSARLLLLSPSISEPFRLTSCAQQDWFSGKEVLEYQQTLSPNLKAMSSFGNPPLRLLLIPFDQVPTFQFNWINNILERRSSSEALAKGVHFIDNIQFSQTKTHEGNHQICVSFLAPKNNDLSDSDSAFIVEVTSSTVLLPLGPLEGFIKSVATNPIPLKTEPCYVMPSTNLEVFSSESEKQYELSFSIHGELNKVYDVSFSVERNIALESSHQLNLKMGDAQLDKIQVPWPFLVENANATFHYKKTEKSPPIKLILKKSLNDPWPSEFEKSSNINIERWQPWIEPGRETGNGLAIHVNSQFPLEVLQDLMRDPDYIPNSALNEVRHIIKAVIGLHFEDKVDVFAIKDIRHPNKNKANFYLRVHPPLRVSPLGAPILLVSVVDINLSEKIFFSQTEAVKREAAQAFQHIFSTAGEMCCVYTYTDEGSALLRYLLRLNSTKMQPSNWQSKNLPRREDWLATFLSPLYMDCIHSFTPTQESSTSMATGANSTNLIKRCGHCNSTQEKMKRCSRCKSVYYCDINCQKTAWSKHKSSCSP